MTELDDPLISDERCLADIYAGTSRLASPRPWPLRDVSPYWVGGLLDGEGHFGINKHVRKVNGRPQYITRVQVGNTEPRLLEPLLVFGGKLDEVEASRWNANAATCFKWTIHSRLAQAFILCVLPYMRHPKKIAAAQTLLKVEFLRKPSGGNRLDDRRVIQQEYYYQEAMRLNARGPKSEALESCRNGHPPDHHCPEFSNTEIEAADLMIRLLDWCHARKMRLAEAVIAKHRFNQSRAHRHGGKAF